MVLKQRRQTSSERERRRASNPNKGRSLVVRGRGASSSLVTKGIRQVLPGRGGGGRSVRWLNKGKRQVVVGRGRGTRRAPVRWLTKEDDQVVSSGREGRGARRAPVRCF